MINCFKSLFFWLESLFLLLLHHRLGCFSSQRARHCHWIAGVNQKSTSHLDILLSSRFAFNLFLFTLLSSSRRRVRSSFLPARTFFAPLIDDECLLPRSVSSRADTFHIKGALCVLLSENWWVCRMKSLFNACFSSRCEAGAKIV